MFHLGDTRSSNQQDHILQTPDTFVRAPFPGMKNATAIVHIGPARGAAFTQYTVEFAADGAYEMGLDQAFVFVLEGEIEMGGRAFAANQYAYLPRGTSAAMKTRSAARVAVFERSSMAHANAFEGDESKIAPLPLNGDDALGVRAMFPGDSSYDFVVNTMSYLPGATLPMVEIHVMEHGLLMLEGEGIYRLGDRWYPVKAGDFIWMAPYCPQWFGALGKKPAKYLLYKDWNRHPLRSK